MSVVHFSLREARHSKVQYLKLSAKRKKKETEGKETHIEIIMKVKY